MMPQVDIAGKVEGRGELKEELQEGENRRESFFI